MDVMGYGMSFNYCDVTGSVIDYSESSGGNTVECEKMKTNPCFCSFLIERVVLYAFFF